MTTPNEPQTTPAAPPRSARWRRVRPRGRGGVIAAVVVAVLVVGAVAAALLGSAGARGDRVAGPGVGLAADAEGPRGLRGDRGPRGQEDVPVVVGTVVSTASGTITVTPDGATAPRTLRIDATTRVRGNGNSAVGDLQAGERVIVRVTGSGATATAASIEVPKASVTGTVTALSGDTATITSVDGLVVSANVAALSQKPVVGDIVVISGTVANGTTITADGIRVLPKAS